MWTTIGAPITDLEFGARYALTKPTRHGRVWARLHKLRVQNPVLVFGDRARWLALQISLALARSARRRTRCPCTQLARVCTPSPECRQCVAPRRGCRPRSAGSACVSRAGGGSSCSHGVVSGLPAAGSRARIQSHQRCSWSPIAMLSNTRSTTCSPHRFGRYTFDRSYPLPPALRITHSRSAMAQSIFGIR